MNWFRLLRIAILLLGLWVMFNSYYGLIEKALAVVAVVCVIALPRRGE